MELRTKGSRPRPRTQKKSEAKAKDSLFENRTSRGQGQECSRPRPRTEDTAASVLLKKRASKIFFRRSPIHWRSQNFWLTLCLPKKFQTNSTIGVQWTPDFIKVSSYNDLTQITILTLNHDINEQFKHKNKLQPQQQYKNAVIRPNYIPYCIS